MENKQFLEVVEEYFCVHRSLNDIELETWTDGGVNMFIHLSLDDTKTLFEQFKERANDFDVDEEIDAHREDKLYKSHFSYRRSVEDFESYEDWLLSIVYELNKTLRSKENGRV